MVARHAARQVVRQVVRPAVADRAMALAMVVAMAGVMVAAMAIMVLAVMPRQLLLHRRRKRLPLQKHPYKIQPEPVAGGKDLPLVDMPCRPVAGSHLVACSSPVVCSSPVAGSHPVAGRWDRVPRRHG